MCAAALRACGVPEPQRNEPLNAAIFQDPLALRAATTLLKARANLAERRRQFLIHWAVYDSRTNLPFVYLMLVEDSGRTGLPKDERRWPRVQAHLAAQSMASLKLVTLTDTNATPTILTDDLKYMGLEINDLAAGLIGLDELLVFNAWDVDVFMNKVADTDMDPSTTATTTRPSLRWK